MKHTNDKKVFSIISAVVRSIIQTNQLNRTRIVTQKDMIIVLAHHSHNHDCVRARVSNVMKALSIGLSTYV